MKLAVIIGIILLAIPVVLSASDTSLGAILEQTFDTINVDIGSVYENYTAIVDFVLYLVLFIFLTQAAFKTKFGEHGKKLAGILGVILAILASFFEYQVGWTIGELAPIAPFIMVGFLLWLIFLFFKMIMPSDGNYGKAVGAIGYIVIYIVVKILVDRWKLGYSSNFFWDGVDVMMTIMGVGLFIAIINLFRGVLGGIGHGDGSVGKGFRNIKEGFSKYNDVDRSIAKKDREYRRSKRQDKVAYNEGKALRRDTKRETAANIMMEKLTENDRLVQEAQAHVEQADANIEGDAEQKLDKAIAILNSLIRLEGALKGQQVDMQRLWRHLQTTYSRMRRGKLGDGTYASLKAEYDKRKNESEKTLQDMKNGQATVQTFIGLIHRDYVRINGHLVQMRENINRTLQDQQTQYAEWLRVLPVELRDKERAAQEWTRFENLVHHETDPELKKQHEIKAAHFHRLAMELSGEAASINKLKAAAKNSVGILTRELLDIEMEQNFVRTLEPLERHIVEALNVNDFDRARALMVEFKRELRKIKIIEEKLLAATQHLQGNLRIERLREIWNNDIERTEIKDEANIAVDLRH